MRGCQRVSKVVHLQSRIKPWHEVARIDTIMIVMGLAYGALASDAAFVSLKAMFRNSHPNPLNLPLPTHLPVPASSSIFGVWWGMGYHFAKETDYHDKHKEGTRGLWG